MEHTCRASCSSVCASSSNDNLMETGEFPVPANEKALLRQGFSVCAGKLRNAGNRSRIPGMNRRKFIETSIATATIASLPGRAFAATHHMEKVGVQLYTVRDAMKADFAGTIAKVAAIGYKEVEFAGYLDHSPKEIRGILDKNGLTSPSVHVTYETVEKHLAEQIEASKIIGHDYIVCPWIDEEQRKQPDG